jgi:hypothetical protein
VVAVGAEVLTVADADSRKRQQPHRSGLSLMTLAQSLVTPTRVSSHCAPAVTSLPLARIEASRDSAPYESRCLRTSLCLMGTGWPAAPRRVAEATSPWLLVAAALGAAWWYLSRTDASGNGPPLSRGPC